MIILFPFAAVPVIGIYDDHDYNNNDGDATFEDKDIAKEYYLDFLGQASKEIELFCVYSEAYVAGSTRTQRIFITPASTPPQTLQANLLLLPGVPDLAPMTRTCTGPKGSRSRSFF